MNLWQKLTSGKSNSPKAGTPSSIRGSFATDSGMLAIWNPAAFASISDYDSWSKELLEDADIERHIEKGDFVPLNIGSDGAFEVEVRVGSGQQPVHLSPREQRYVFVQSAPYLYNSEGRLCVSGIEHIEARPFQRVGQTAISIGRWSVTVAMIGWEDEPGARGADGKPTSSALPDFVALINPINDENVGFRTKLETFDRPG